MPRPVALSLALLWWLANALLHLAFSNWLVAAQSTPFGPVVPLHHATAAAVLVSVLFAAIILRQAARATSPGRTLSLWLAWVLAVLACDRWLLTTRVESIHYLQYGIIAVLLAWALDPQRRRWPLLEVLLLSLLLSIADELYQYLSLTARQGTYFDFNDLLLNQFGTLAGLLFYYGFRSPPMAPPASRQLLLRFLLVTLAGLCVVSLLLLQAGVFSISPPGYIEPGGVDRSDGHWRLYWQREPGLYGSWLATFTEGVYFVLSPLQGLALLALTSVACLPALLRRVSRSTDRDAKIAPGF